MRPVTNLIFAALSLALLPISGVCQAREMGKASMTVGELSKSQMGRMREQSTAFQHEIDNKYYVEGEKSRLKSKADKAYESAGLAMDANKPKEALALFEKAIAAIEGPEEKKLYKDQRMYNFHHSRAYVGRALCFIKLDEWQKAKNDLTDAIFFAPDYSAPYYIRAKVYQHLGQKDECMADMAKASNLKPVPAFILNDLRKQGTMDGPTAKMMNEKFAELRKKRAQQYYVGGLDGLEKSKSDKLSKYAFQLREDEKYLEARNQYSKVIESLKSASEIALFKDQKYRLEHLAMAHQNRAFCSLMMKDFTPAIADLTEAIKLQPTWQDSYLNRAKAYKNIGKMKESEADFTKARTLLPEGPRRFE